MAGNRKRSAEEALERQEESAEQLRSSTHSSSEKKTGTIAADSPASTKASTPQNLSAIDRLKRTASLSSLFSQGSNGSIARNGSDLNTPSPKRKKGLFSSLSATRSRDRLPLSVADSVESPPSPEDQQAKEAREKQEAREAELDAELPEKYRKFRPKGYKFNVPREDGGPIRIYADGVFDLFHLGHMRQLEQAKKALPNVELIVGVPSDTETHAHKGLTVLSDEIRCETLKHCKWVDEVVPNAPWSVTPEFLEKHRIDYVAHDDIPYVSAGSDDVYRPVKEMGKFLTTQRTDGISTSDIITKIIRDYDKYLMRNFARGATRKELNVSWLKKNEIDLKRHVQEFRESFKQNFDNVSKDVYSEIMSYLSSRGILHREQGADSNSGPGPSGSSSASTLTESLLGTRSAPRSPVLDFASNYSGGSYFGRVKDWVYKRVDTPTQSSSDSEDDDNSLRA